MGASSSPLPLMERQPDLSPTCMQRVVLTRDRTFVAANYSDQAFFVQRSTKREQLEEVGGPAGARHGGKAVCEGYVVLTPRLSSSYQTFL